MRAEVWAGLQGWPGCRGGVRGDLMRWPPCVWYHIYNNVKYITMYGTMCISSKIVQELIPYLPRSKTGTRPGLKRNNSKGK